jgi:hypothetical protein
LTGQQGTRTTRISNQLKWTGGIKSRTWHKDWRFFGQLAESFLFISSFLIAEKYKRNKVSYLKWKFWKVHDQNTKKRCISIVETKKMAFFFFLILNPCYFIHFYFVIVIFFNHRCSIQFTRTSINSQSSEINNFVNFSNPKTYSIQTSNF